jgi:hypothetical protein
MKAWSIFSKKTFNAPPPASLSPQRQLSATNTLRRELVNVALRSTLHKHGIPPGWLAIEIQSGTSSKGELHSYVRLLLKHWDTEFLPHMVALQNSLLKRIFLLDTTAHGWLRSIGWQFALADESACPEMPASPAWSNPIIKIAPIEPGPGQDAPPPVSMVSASAARALRAKPEPAPAPHESPLDMLLRTMSDYQPSAKRRGGHVDFQNTEPFDPAEAGARR